MLFQACGTRENASVTVTYTQIIQSGDWQFGMLPRASIQKAFEQFSTENGYRCFPHPRRVEEITCRGPNDLHLKFLPAINRPEFVATFTWLRSRSHTHEEFMEQVLALKRQMDSTGMTVSVSTDSA